MHQSLSAKYLMNRFNVNVGKEAVLPTARHGGKTDCFIPSSLAIAERMCYVAAV
jgi:hypothetical protein